MRVAVWLCPDQCDWWVSGDPEELARVLPALADACGVSTLLWANDAVGADLLRRLGLGV